MGDIERDLSAYLDEVQERRHYSIDAAVAQFGQFKHLCVFGAGMTSRILLRLLGSMTDRKVDFLCDNDPATWGTILPEGLPCISPLELERYRDDVGIIIATRYCTEVYDQLRKLNFKHLFVVREYRLLDGRYYKNRENIGEIKRNVLSLSGLLGDDRSKEILSALVHNWFDIDVERGGYGAVCTDDEYYPEGIITLGTREAFVDGGAYDGDTLLKFLEKAGGVFDAVYSFELDAENFRALEKTVAGLDAATRAKVRLFNLGLFDEEREIQYEKGNTLGYNSRVRDGGGGSISGRVVRLSDFLRDKKVTFVKVDVEGADLKALRGAEELLRAQAPKVAACVYHELEHLWEIPFYLKSVLPDSRLFLRHHSVLEYGTVCYAVS